MIAMPPPDQRVLARRAEIVAALRRIVPGEGVIDAEHERRAFECDGLTAYRQLPMAVVPPETTAQVVEVLRYCSANNVKVVPRGAGTSLSGGALPLEDGVLLGLGKFNRVLEIDIANRCVVAQPGVPPRERSSRTDSYRLFSLFNAKKEGVGSYSGALICFRRIWRFRLSRAGYCWQNP